MVPSFFILEIQYCEQRMAKRVLKTGATFGTQKREHHLVIGCNNLLSTIMPLLRLKIGTAAIAPAQLRSYARLAKA